MESLEEIAKKMEAAAAAPRDDMNQAVNIGMGQHRKSNAEVKYSGPDGVVIDVSQTGWVGTRGLD